MSRVAKKLIPISGISYEITEQLVTLKKGNFSSSLSIPHGILLQVKDDFFQITFTSDTLKAKAGMFRSLLNNAVQGLLSGYSKTLELKGLGFRVASEGNSLILSLGYSHKISYTPPAGVVVKCEKDTIIVITGIDKQRVGQVAADIRSLRYPDSYHAKGVLYQGEKFITKEGKKK